MYRKLYGGHSKNPTTKNVKLSRSGSDIKPHNLSLVNQTLIDKVHKCPHTSV